MNLLNQFNQRVSQCLSFCLVVIFALLVVDVLWGVASRYAFGAQASWSEELARLLMVWLALLGAAKANRDEAHLGLDVVVRQWPEQVQRLGRMVVLLCVIGFTSIVMAWGGSQLVFERFQSGQTLSALGISKAWFYVAIPFSGSLMTLSGIESLLAEWIAKPASTLEKGTVEK